MITVLGSPRVTVTPSVAVRAVYSIRVEQAAARLGFPAADPSNVRKTVVQIQKVVAAHYALTQTELISERRSRDVARPRQISMWICKQITTRSLPDIGRRHGDRDHTTVLHAVRRIDALILDEPEIERDCRALLAQLGGIPA